MTAASPSGSSASSVPATWAPSSTISTCGRSVAGSACGLNPERRVSSAPSRSSQACSDGSTSRTGPAKSTSLGCRACGSHFTQAQFGWSGRAVHTMMISSVGAWNTAAWQSRARTSARAASGSVRGRR